MEEPCKALCEVLRLGVALAALLAREVAVIGAVTLVLPPSTSGFGLPLAWRMAYCRRGAGVATSAVVEGWATQVVIPPFGGVADSGGGVAIVMASGRLAISATLALILPSGKVESPVGGIRGETVPVVATHLVTRVLIPPFGGVAVPFRGLSGVAASDDVA